MCTWNSAHKKKLFTSLLNHVAQEWCTDMSTGLVNVEEWHAKKWLLSTYSCCTGIVHADMSTGDQRTWKSDIRKSWLLLYLFMCTWLWARDQCMWNSSHEKKLSTSLLIHVHLIMSTGPAHVEECTCEKSLLLLYLFMCTGLWARDQCMWNSSHEKKLSTSLLIHVHGIMSKGTAHEEQCTWKKLATFLQYLFICTSGIAHVEQCTHDIDACRWLDGGRAKTHTAGLDWVGIQFKFELNSVGICSIKYTLYTFSILRLAFCALSPLSV